MAVYNHEKHDIGLLRQDGSTTVGLMLLRKNDVPCYERVDEPAIVAQRATGEAGYGWFDPSVEFPVTIQDSWREGFGLETYDDDEPERYFDASDMDLRFRGMAICGPKITTVTNPSAPTEPTITNADMELTTGWTNGSRDNAQAHGGTYSWAVDNQVAYQTLTWDDQYQGLEMTYTCWVWANAPAKAKISWNDGVRTHTSSAHAGDSSWAQLSIAGTIDRAATQIKLNLDSTGSSSAYYFDDAAIAFTALTLTASEHVKKFNDEEYRAFGTVLAKLDAAGTAFDFVHQFPSPIAALEPFSDSFLYIAQEATQVIEDCEDVWDESVDGDVTASLDTGDYKVGSGSNKFVCKAALAAGDIIATEAISSLDLSQHTGIKFWTKCSVAANAGDLQILLDDTANCASPLETLDVPALSAGQWTRCYVALSNPSSDTAVISVGLKYTTDLGACTIWLDDIRAEDHYWYMDSGESLTQSTHASGFAHFFQTIQATSPTLYKALKPNELKSATTPTNTANWGSSTDVDSLDYEITELLELENSLYIAKEDRPFYLDSSGNVQVLIDGTKNLAGGADGANAFAWRNKLYFPYGTQSLVEYDSGTITWRDPAGYATNLGTFDGEIKGVTGDEQWLFIAVEATALQVIAGRLETINSSTKWVWHPIAHITGETCDSMSMSNVYQRRIWLGTTASGPTYKARYFPLPDGYSDPTADSNRSFQTDGSFTTPWLHGNFKGDDKAFIKLTLQLDDTSSTVYYEAHYQKLGDSSWTDIGDFKTSPETTQYLPVDGSGNNPVSVMIRFKFVAKTGSTTSTPKLLGYDIRGILRPQKTNRKRIKCIVHAADGLVNKQGKSDAITATHIKTVLDEANEATWPVKFYPIDYDPVADDYKYVNFLPMQEVVTKQERNKNPEKDFYLELQEVVLS